MIHTFLTVDGLEIEYFDTQTGGTPVFLFHGNSSSASVYLPLVASTLAHQYRFIAVSFPGHGQSSDLQYDETFSIAFLGDFTKKVVDCFSFTQYILVGQSLGGHALLESLDKHRNAIGLGLISSPPISLSKLSYAFKEDPTGGLLFKNELNESEVTRFARAFLEKDDQRVQNQLEASIASTSGRFREALGKSLMAGLVKDEIFAFNNTDILITMFRGTEDKFIHREYYDNFTKMKLWENSTIDFKGCGHALNLESPVEFERYLAMFLDAVTENAAATVD